MAENSSFNHFGLRLNTKATRSEIELHLNGRGISTSISNVCILNKKHHYSDENVLINHNAPECKSRQVFKSIVENECTGVFWIFYSPNSFIAGTKVTIGIIFWNCFI